MGLARGASVQQVSAVSRVQTGRNGSPASSARASLDDRSWVRNWRPRAMSTPAPGWLLDAACGPDVAHLFSTESDDPLDVHAAKLICADCPVVEQCRDFAIDQGHAQGIWGGMSPAERRRYRWTRSRPSTDDCVTTIPTTFQCQAP